MGQPQQKIQIKGQNSGGLMQSNPSQANLGGGYSLVAPRISSGSTNNLSAMGVAASAASVQASTTSSKRPGGDVVDASSSKKLKATQSSSNIQSMQQSNNNSAQGSVAMMNSGSVAPPYIK